MTVRLMDAGEAHGLGLINHLVEKDELIPTACRIVREFAAKPSVAWVRTKARFREIALSGLMKRFAPVSSDNKRLMPKVSRRR